MKIEDETYLRLPSFVREIANKDVLSKPKLNRISVFDDNPQEISITKDFKTETSQDYNLGKRR